MPRASDGVVTLPANDSNPAVPRNTIKSADWNEIIADIQSVLTDSFSRSGDGEMLADLDLGGFQLVNGAVTYMTADQNLSDVADASASRTNLGVAIGTDVQAYDAALASIAGLTTSANQLIYTTGSDTYATATLTSFARTLLDDTDQATAQGTLGVVPGTDVQEYSALLQEFADLTLGTEGQVLAVGAGSALEWTDAGAGDMLALTYDPNTIAGDAFDRGNHIDFTTSDITAKTIPALVLSFVTSGYTAAGDGGGALWKRISTPSPVEVWHIQSDDGAYWELAEAVVHPEMLGAVGDGVADDTAELQACIEYVSEKAAHLEIPNKTFLVSDTTGGVCLQVPDDGRLSISGTSRDRSRLKTVSQAAILGGVDLEHFECRNLGFEGSGTASRITWQRPIRLHGCLRMVVDFCYFKDNGDGVINIGRFGYGGSDQLGDGSRQPEMVQITNNLIEGGYGTVAIVTKYVGSKQTIISNNIIRDCCSVGISAESEDGTVDVEFAEEITIVGNIVSGCDFAKTDGFSAIAWGITCTEQAKEITIAGNVVTDITGDTVAAGFALSTSPAQNDRIIKNLVISGNIAQNIIAASGRSHGYLLSNGDAFIEDITITGNQARDAECGISFQTGVGTDTLGEILGLSITGNSISNCSEIGIFFSQLSGEGDIPLRKSVISSNIIRECGVHGMALEMDGGVVTGNSCTLCDSSGIFIAVGSTDVLVSNNYCEKNGANGISGNGAGNSYNGNKCMNNGQGGATSYGIYHQTGANASFIGNVCGDNQGTATQDYGIRGVGGETCRLNELLGNALNPLWNGIAAFNTGTYDAGLNRTA